MEKERDSKEYAWKWITAKELLSTQACDLCYVLLTSLTTAASSITLYDGENIKGTLIAIVESLGSRSTEFTPAKSIYCRKGLYVDMTVVDNAKPAALIQWRVRASEEG